MQTYEELCGLGHLFAEIASSGDATRFAELVRPDYVNHNPYVEQGLDGVIGFFGHFMQAVPDLKVTAQSVLADVDNQAVIGRYTYSGEPPQLSCSTAMFRKRRTTNGKQATEARRDCLEVTAG
ncbi:nuclear transport factor 2 family protein, partial [Ruegeria sp. SCPT10]|uniref:nuclear transport factor 2 family protein n=1 Tax=Ruegeria sp. SCP10 TaxID=3141377 RepID=UPI003335F374